MTVRVLMLLLSHDGALACTLRALVAVLQQHSTPAGY